MSNTLIQIKRSTGTAAPAALYIGEQAYSYNSGKLFIGTTGSDDVIEIGGKYFVDHLNAVWTYANTLGSSGASTDYANNVGIAGNTYANAVGSAGNTYAEAIGTAANTLAGVMANSANAYTSATYLPLSGGTLTGDLTVSANLTVTGTTTYVNTQSLLVSDNIFVLNADLPVDTAASQDAGMQVNRGSDANVYVLWNESSNKWTFTNDGSTYQNFVGNTDLETVATSANGYATTVGSSGNTYAEAIGTAGNAYAVSVGTAGNAYAVSVGTAGNTYADAVGTAANTNAANASYITTGTLAVARGGTGNTSFTTNGVLIGQGTSAVTVAIGSGEGTVLQIAAGGAPQFGFLDGGSF